MVMTSLSIHCLLVSLLGLNPLAFFRRPNNTLACASIIFIAPMNVILALKGCAFCSNNQLFLHSNDTAVWAAAQKTPEAPDVWSVILVCNDYLEINKLSDGNVLASSPGFLRKNGRRCHHITRHSFVFF